MGPFLEGKVALVTGGAQGIGWAISQALADYGAQVVETAVSITAMSPGNIRPLIGLNHR